MLAAGEPGAEADAPAKSLLLACSFFDTKCAGYLETEDLEEILNMTNADASRECAWTCWPDGGELAARDQCTGIA